MKLRTFTNAIVMLGLLLLCGSFSQTASAQTADWDYVRVRSPLTEVVVTTKSGSYTATFQNDATVYPTGRADGLLSFQPDGGKTIRYNVVAGRVLMTEGQVTEVRLLMRRVGADPGDELDIAVVRPAPVSSEECLIYDIFGADVSAVSDGLRQGERPSAQFDAHGWIEVIRF